MTIHKGFPDFKNEEKAFKKLAKDLPKIVGQIAVDHAIDNFDREAFKDGSKSTKWAARKSSKKRDVGKNLLVQSGDLRASIDYEVSGNNVTVGSDKIYAKIHNEGGQAGRNHSATIPKRQFMGNSKDIEDAVDKHLDKELDKIFGG